MAENEEPKVKLGGIKIYEGIYVAKITLQNPPLNQLSGEVLSLIASYLERVKADEKVKALVVEGRGLFSAGADVGEIWAITQENNKEKALKLLAQANAIPDAIQNLGKPSLAVINGPCLGGGNELAMACTARIASDENTTVLGQPEIKLGIMPGMGGTQRLPRLIPLDVAVKLLLSGVNLSAMDALKYRLVDKVVSKTNLDAEALVFSKQLIGGDYPVRTQRVFDENEFNCLVKSTLFKPSEGTEAIIQAVKIGMALPLAKALKLEQELFAELLFKDSAKKGLAEFLGKDRESKGARFLLPDSKLPDVFTVRDLNEDQLLIRDSIREVVADTIATSEANTRIESKDFQYTRELMKKFADLGILGVEIPEEYGGVNLGNIVSAVVAEEISIQGSFACTFLAHTGIGILPIKFFGTEEQKKKYLPKLISGEWISAYSLTEGTAGSDANSVKAIATLSGDGKYYILNGEKIFVTNGGFADLFIIFAKIDGKDLTAFIVEREFEGLRIGKEEHKMGILGSSTATILLDSVRVPVENLLGEQGKGFKIAVNVLNLGRFKLGAACLGAGRVCLKESLNYAKDRKQFGLPISKFGAIRRKLAEMAAKNYAMEAVVYRTAGLLEEAIHSVDSKDSRAVLKAIEEFAVECSIVKVSCSEALDFIVDENVQIHGGSGYCEELSPARHYRDSRINRIFEGTNEINRLVAIGMVLKKVFLGTLPLLDAYKNVIQELETEAPSVEPEDTVELLNLYLNNAKKATLVLLGMAYEKFGIQLDKHQIVLTNLADCLIVIYVLESVLAALKKDETDTKLPLTWLVFNDNLPKLEKLTRELVGMCSGNDKMKSRTAMVSKLTGFTSHNVEDLCNKISENLLGA